MKHGFVLAPTIFCIFIGVILQQATDSTDDVDVVHIRYRLDGSLFNLRRLQANSKIQENLILKLLFADDADLVAHTEHALQRIMACFADSSRLFGLEFSQRMTEVLHQHVPDEEFRPLHIANDDFNLKSLQQHTYLDCITSSDAKIDKEINN